MNNKFYIFAVGLVFALFGAVSSSQAASLVPGDVLVVDPSAPGEAGVFKINPSTWQATLISSNGYFSEPMGIALSGDGNILIGDPQYPNGNGPGAVFKINPATGAQTILSSGNMFTDPRGIAVAANGDIFVADSDAFGYYGGIIKVDPSTGAQTKIYQSADINAGPIYLAFDASGNLVVSDVSGASKGIVRVNPTTGAWSQLSSGGNFVYPQAITVAANGDIFVADNGGKIIKVNPISGSQTVIASGYPLVCPVGIAFDNVGDLLVSDPCNEPGAIIKVNPVTGTASVVANNFGSVSPNGLAVVPQPKVCAVPPSGIVSEWSGDGNTNDVVDGNPGILQNGATFATGKIGQAFSFDGLDDRVLIGNPVNLRLQDFTIDTWIKLNTLNIDYAERIAGYSIGGYGFFLAGPPLVNSNGASAVRQLSLDKAGFDMVAAPFSINDLEWHHVAVTKSGGIVTFYLDGVSGVAQRGGSPVTYYNPGFAFNTQFMLGNLDGQNQPLPGLLDEMGIYNRALALSEIQQRYQNGLNNNCEAAPQDEVVFQPAGGLNDGTDDGSALKGQDTYISGTRYGDWDTNYGSNNELFFDYYRDYNGYPLLKFDVLTLPGDAASAKLYLYITGDCGGGSCPNMNWTVNAITAPWNEMTATWNTRPALSGDYGTLNIPSSPTGAANAKWVSVDITNLYNGWKNGTIPNYGIGFTRLGSTWDGGVWFNNAASSDYETPSLRPKLVINGGFNQADVQPPVITVPSDIIAEAVAPEGVVVAYEASATDNVGVTSFACAPASGSVFPIGTTAVTCTASDAAGNSASASFNVTVNPPAGYTAPGDNVAVTLDAGISLIFASIADSGITTVAVSSAGPALPTQFKLGNPPIYYDITTTASYIAPIEVCFNYAGVNYQNENNLKLRHFDGTSWIDITKPGYPDTVNDIICGVTDSLSPFAITEPAEQNVKIDIKPGSYPNSINPKSNGKLPVAILSSLDFDAVRQVAKSSLTFGRTGDEPSLSFCNTRGEDVNRDGFLDLVCHFQAQQSNFQAGNTEGVLKGKTVNNIPLTGKDSIRLVPAN